ncbi:MAG TPA: hypothetical protein VEZ44_01215, partial [bacterium]|nr:hypothetical protein [bacterium]
PVPLGVDAIPSGSALVLVVGRDAGNGATATDTVGTMMRRAAAGGPVAAVAVGVPYGLARLPRDVGCLAVYGADPASLRAAARVLAGTLQPRGRLPVTLAEPDETHPETTGEA